MHSHFFSDLTLTVTCKRMFCVYIVTVQNSTLFGKVTHSTVNCTEHISIYRTLSTSRSLGSETPTNPFQKAPGSSRFPFLSYVSQDLSHFFPHRMENSPFTPTLFNITFELGTVCFSGRPSTSNRTTSCCVPSAVHYHTM